MAVTNPKKVAQIIAEVPYPLAIDGAPPQTASLEKHMQGNASAVSFAVINAGEIDCVGAVGKPSPSHPVPFAAPPPNSSTYL